MAKSSNIRCAIFHGWCFDTVIWVTDLQKPALATKVLF